MEHSSHHLLLLLIFLILLITATGNSTTVNTTTTTTATATPPPRPEIPQEINNILDALIGSGDTSINKWVTILTLSNPLLSFTLFIPQQHQTTQSLDPFSFPYHVVPQRLTFHDLLLIPRNARLPTLLPGKSIAVTDNSAANFSLDDTPITHPDLYSTPSLAAHGVRTLLDYSLYGDAASSSSLPRNPLPPFLPVGETWKSAAPYSATVNLNLFLFFSLLLQQFVFA